ncbi:MAG: hypothetical protein GY835_24505, partial [bacterium]|nr:hypothetical protein [bacterium]
MMKRLPGVITPPALKEPPTDFIPMSERPTAVQDYVRQYAPSQEADTGRQEKEVPMDQSSSHDVSSTVGSGGRSVSSEITLSQVAAELQALDSFSYES